MLKLVGGRPRGYGEIAELLARLRPFRCRVVANAASLTDAVYVRLARASTYAVNASSGEGQCLPLMESMSCGMPAISPRHTGMEDYVDETNAFLVDTSLEPASWPQDPRRMYRTLSHRLNVASLMAVFRESYRVARDEPARYQAMSRSAVERLRRHCSFPVVREKLARYLRARPRRQGPGFSSGHRRAVAGIDGQALLARRRGAHRSRLLRGPDGGVFVDVGCASPVADSTTCYLERHLGWSGIAVDALPEYGPPFTAERPARRSPTSSSPTTRYGRRVLSGPGRTGAVLDRAAQKTVGKTWGRSRSTFRRPRWTSSSTDTGSPPSTSSRSTSSTVSSPSSLASTSSGSSRGSSVSSGGGRRRIQSYFVRHGYERIERYRRYDPSIGTIAGGARPDRAAPCA